MSSDSSTRNVDSIPAAIEVAHWIVITALHHPRIVAAKGKLAVEVGRDEDVNRLCRSVCDRSELLNVLAFAKEMPALYPQWDADTLRKLAADLRRVLRRMKFVTPSIVLPWFETSADGTERLSWQSSAGDLDLSPELEKQLQLRVEMYGQLARLCSRREIPSRATFRKFAYLWPVQYINSSTGQPHYAVAARLLGFAGIDKNEKQLKVAFVAVRQRYPWVLSWMDLAIGFLHGRASPSHSFEEKSLK